MLATRRRLQPRMKESGACRRQTQAWGGAERAPDRRPLITCDRQPAACIAVSRQTWSPGAEPRRGDSAGRGAETGRAADAAAEGPAPPNCVAKRDARAARPGLSLAAFQLFSANRRPEHEGGNMASTHAALEKAAVRRAEAHSSATILPALSPVPFGATFRLWARQGAKEATTDLRGTASTCALSVGPRWESQCNPARRPTPTCWPCRTGRSWSATSASSACWAPAASASPTSPKRSRSPASSPSRNTSRPTTPRAAASIDASPRSRRCAADYKWGLDALHRGGADARPLRALPTSCACTATSAPTTPATWCSTSRRAAASSRG